MSAHAGGSRGVPGTTPLQILVIGKECLSKAVRGVEGRHCTVDLGACAGRDVDLELGNTSDDAHGFGQVGYWDKVYLSCEP